MFTFANVNDTKNVIGTRRLLDFTELDYSTSKRAKLRRNRTTPSCKSFVDRTVNKGICSNQYLSSSLSYVNISDLVMFEKMK